ncbi:hypothetical protein BHE74_00045181 [Ensete ventricosum]|nr:hypothetical protein BHE74_00045181 [Ensete ventricosum]
MARYLTKAHRLIGMTKYSKISQIPHLENSRADALARSASTDTTSVLPAIPSLRRPTIVTIEMTTMVALPDWREEILYYKGDMTLPMDKAATHRVKITEACSALRSATTSVNDSTSPSRRTLSYRALSKLECRTLTSYSSSLRQFLRDSNSTHALLTSSSSSFTRSLTVSTKSD